MAAHIQGQHIAEEAEIFARAPPILVAIHAAGLNIVQIVDHHVLLSPSGGIHLRDTADMIYRELTLGNFTPLGSMLPEVNDSFVGERLLCVSLEDVTFDAPPLKLETCL